MAFDTVRDDSGMALVIVLMFMLLISIMGTMVFSTSTTEIRISRNNRLEQEAFYGAERGVEYAKADPNIYAAIGTGSVNIPMAGVDLRVGSSDASGTVSYLATGNPPRGSGVDITQFKANYYLVDSTGTSTGNSRVNIETNVVKILPRE